MIASGIHTRKYSRVCSLNGPIILRSPQSRLAAPQHEDPSHWGSGVTIEGHTLAHAPRGVYIVKPTFQRHFDCCSGRIFRREHRLKPLAS
jgi:hypothetical protein